MSGGWSKKKADPALVEQFEKDPMYVQWNDIAKSNFFLTGEIMHFSETKKLMQPQIDAGLIEETDYRGWYKFTERGWNAFTFGRQHRTVA
jgi:hypothetical protein